MDRRWHGRRLPEQPELPGSGLDIGDIRPAEDRYYFARCSIRHASFSTAAQESVELNVEADDESQMTRLRDEVLTMMRSGGSHA